MKMSGEAVTVFNMNVKLCIEMSELLSGLEDEKFEQVLCCFLPDQLKEQEVSKIRNSKKNKASDLISALQDHLTPLADVYKVFHQNKLSSLTSTIAKYCILECFLHLNTARADSD